ncbi:flagellar protein FlaF [Cognatiyoonia koreensis]|uniref:Flagellar protein FlaF n=1 Tax=Cognatiyoonia koreensis TaxID=364200 RepID=A0A1I0RJN3_9RHOB|nr:flagellar biosynthesis regulator FlaF [Cognatiyoonia koreensis]SEW41202.1 flagellar protein FlaF [Cognatiyoonia koreensis]
MNVSEQARRAYAPTHLPIHTPRSVEASLLSQVTAALKKTLEGATHFADTVSAVHRNREMWIVLASDVADPENALPDMLRAQIFYLAEFTEQHSHRILRGEADATALIDVNSAVLRGLHSQGTAT